MAESTREITGKRPRPKAGTGNAEAARKQTDKLEMAVKEATGAPETAAKSRFGFFSALGGRKTTSGATTSAATTKGGATTAASGAKPLRQQTSMGRFFFGMSLYLVLALAAQFALTFIFARLPESYTTQSLFILPLLGGVSVYVLTWMIVLVLILYGLYKFKVLPRSLAQPRDKMATVKADPRAIKAPSTRVVREPLTGPDDDVYARVKARIRADRRKARRG